MALLYHLGLRLLNKKILDEFYVTSSKFSLTVWTQLHDAERNGVLRQLTQVVTDLQSTSCQTLHTFYSWIVSCCLIMTT